ncbi:MAG: FliM/FliN family flagellar motor switch protein [Planctomycetia bacterium]|nr:FliM/FliN family flagellar motor switch protein [Planctomycetia bacterium]
MSTAPFDIPHTVLNDGRREELRAVGGGLEKFLDIYGEIVEISPPTPNEQPPQCPKAFWGPGFALTFPYGEKSGLFVAAEHGEILPPWYLNPGIAGKSRLFLLSQTFAAIFASPAALDAENERAECAFYKTASYFAGRVASLVDVFNALDWGKETIVQSLIISRFDGRKGNAWIFTPIMNPSVLYEFAQNDPAPLVLDVSHLKPVRNLEPWEVEKIEKVENTQKEECAREVVETLGTQETIETQETQAAVRTQEKILEEPIVCVPDFSWIREKRGAMLGKFSNRARDLRVLSDFGEKFRRARQKKIESHIFYAHPRNSQTWRRVGAQLEEKWLIDAQTLAQQNEHLPYQAEDLVESEVMESIAPQEILEETCPRQATKQPIPQENLLHLPLTLSVACGVRKIPLRALLALEVGSVLNLGTPCSATLPIFLNETPVGNATLAEHNGTLVAKIDAFHLPTREELP